LLNAVDFPALIAIKMKFLFELAHIYGYSTKEFSERIYKNLDWETFQKEYRDAIDFRKMLQMVPGIGAVAGAWANYSIVEELGGAAINCYRMRRFSEGVQ
jgi:uncharacterized protein (DUF697 family)